MKITRQLVYREATPVDGDIISVSPESREYDLLPGKTNSTKFCWIEPAKGARNFIIDMWAGTGLLLGYMVRGFFIGVGFSLAALGVLTSGGFL